MKQDKTSIVRSHHLIMIIKKQINPISTKARRSARPTMALDETLNETDSLSLVY